MATASQRLRLGALHSAGHTTRRGLTDWFIAGARHFGEWRNRV